MDLSSILALPFNQVREFWRHDAKTLESGSAEQIAEIADRHALELKIGPESYQRLNEETVGLLLKHRVEGEHYFPVPFGAAEKYAFQRTCKAIKDNVKRGKLMLPQFSEETDKVGRASLTGDGGTYIRTILLGDEEIPFVKGFVKVFPSGQSRKATIQNEADIHNLMSINNRKIATPNYNKGLISSYFFYGHDAFRYIQALGERGDRPGEHRVLREVVKTHLEVAERGIDYKKRIRNLEEFNDHAESFYTKYVLRANAQEDRGSVISLMDSYDKEIGQDLDGEARIVMNGDSKLSNALVSRNTAKDNLEIKLIDWEFVVEAPIQKLAYDLSRSYDNPSLIADIVYKKSQERGHGMSREYFDNILQKEFIHEDLLSSARCLELSRSSKVKDKAEMLRGLADFYYNRAVRELDENSAFRKALVQYNQDNNMPLNVLDDSTYTPLEQEYIEGGQGLSTMLYPLEEKPIADITKKLQRPRKWRRRGLAIAALSTLVFAGAAKNMIDNWKYEAELQVENDRWNRQNTYMLQTSDPRKEIKQAQETGQWQDYLEHYGNEQIALAAIYAKDEVDAAIKRYGSTRWNEISKDLPKLLKDQVWFHAWDGIYDNWMSVPWGDEEAILSDAAKVFSNYSDTTRWSSWYFAERNWSSENQD